MVSDVIDNSWAATGSDNTETTPVITLSPDVLEALNILRDFLFERVYDAQAMEAETEKGIRTVHSLYHHFVKHPGELPQELLRNGNEVERAVVDYIAGMTDLYALRVAEEVLE